jgi:hypothetical protein
MFQKKFLGIGSAAWLLGGSLVAGTAGIGVGSCVGRLLGFSYLFADVQAT